jgi:hypothetical protein
MSKRRMYCTNLDLDLIIQIRILAAQLDKRQNDLLEEAIQDVLKKYNIKDEPETILNAPAGYR